MTTPRSAEGQEPAAPERVVVLGAGMAGLCVALALAPTGRRIVLLDRDPPPPAGNADAVFEHWARRGASQLRHSHAFLARMRRLLADEHPSLLAELREAGARELTFAEGLPPTIARDYAPAAGDEAMAIIISRRSTLEMVMRRHVERSANVAIRSGVFVRGLISEREANGGRAARGLLLDGGEAVLGDLVVDAGGRGSPIREWMGEAGRAVPEDVEDCRILYYTRFYRRTFGTEEPARGSHPLNGDLGYLKFGVFPADADTFSITLAVPEVERTLRAAVVRPKTFEAICALLPGVAPWTNPAAAMPASRVFAMGDLSSRWRDMAPAGRPLMRNIFSVGDSLVRTNPLYGRGCAFAAVEAHILRDALAGADDAAVRAKLYEIGVRRALRPYFDSMRIQDRAAARRADRGLNPDHRPSWGGRLTRWILEEGVAPAVRQDVNLLRQAMSAFHMLTPPNAWLARPSTVFKIARVLARGRSANAHLRAAPAGPPRGEMFEALELSAAADLSPQRVSMASRASRSSRASRVRA